MKLVRHERTPKPETMELRSNPMTVWLERSLELRIQSGDTVKKIGMVLEEHWGLATKEARQLAAFWFALGERRSGATKSGPWRKNELYAEPDRAYRPRGS